MTQKEINKVKASLPPLTQRNKEQKKIDDELGCREMINSCLCYGSIEDFWAERNGSFDGSYATPYVNDLGLDRVKEIVEEQIRDFEKATVKRNVYTDNEGCSYNSIVWGDEVKKIKLDLYTDDDSYRDCYYHNIIYVYGEKEEIKKVLDKTREYVWLFHDEEYDKIPKEYSKCEYDEEFYLTALKNNFKVEFEQYDEELEYYF